MVIPATRAITPPEELLQLSVPIGPGHKGFPPALAHESILELRTRRLHLFRDFQFPIMVIRASAMEHNLRRMAAFCHEHRLSIAPHGKTTMAPQLFKRQLELGAWGMTAANVDHAQVMRACGIQRILIANEIVDQHGLDWIARELSTDTTLELFCLVDSIAGVERMTAAFDAAGCRRPLDVLIELGVPGKRAGCRDERTALEVADAVCRAGSLRLAGLECFEGVAGSNRQPETLAAVDRLLKRVVDLAQVLDLRDAFSSAQEIILSAGGSVFFDRVGPVIHSADLSSPTRVVLRSGCYITHDHGTYDRASALGSSSGDPRPFRAALQIWAEVLSTPEPRRAILGVGKRDAPFDSGLPSPLQLRSADDSRMALEGRAEIVALNDQHAWLEHEPRIPLHVGDRVALGISHPCTAFDKWRLIPVVDEGDVVADVIRTFF